MAKKSFFIVTLCLLATGVFLQSFRSPGKTVALKNVHFNNRVSLLPDTLPPADAMEVIFAVVYSTNDFDIAAVANLYTPNAIVADDEPPYSWNGPTAGVQWVYAVEKACKDNKITKLKASIETVTVFQQNGDNIYVVVPVSYNGNTPGKRHFNVRGVYNFVLRQINGKWIIKSQTWISSKGTRL